MIKNIDVFIKKKNYPLSSSNFQLECLFNDDEKNTSESENDKFEFLKNPAIFKNDEFLELEKNWDEEIHEEIRKILILVEKKQEYDYFNNDFIVYKKGKNNEKIQKWLKNENVLEMLDLTKTQKNKENDVFKEILNFDGKYQRVLENHLRKIEEMKESLNNFTQEKENLEKLKEKSELKNENYGEAALKIEKNDENNQNVKKNAVNEEKNKSKIEKTPILEERVVLRSK